MYRISLEERWPNRIESLVTGRVGQVCTVCTVHVGIDFRKSPHHLYHPYPSMIIHANATWCWPI